MARNTHEAALDAVIDRKYTTDATSHSVGERTNRATRMPSGSTRKARRPLVSAGMSFDLTL
jgi:hypothetical protein